jgi:hypothetical protein
MFDLSNIDIIKTDQQRGYSGYSFVGIQRNQQTDRLEFWLPVGFDNFDHTNFNLVKNFSLDKIIEGYDELRISSLEKKQMRSSKIDYSKIYRYMHQAIYLDEDVIYIDEMNIAKNILIKESPPILQLFCFIYTEIKKELEELDNISDRTAELAEEFKESYLQPNSSLFSENSFAETINILREKLEDIDNKISYKDEDYWHFFEAVEAFLYGERQEDNEGIYWGFSSFYDVWEDMCQIYAINAPEYKTRAIFAEVKGRRKNLVNYPRVNPFELKLNYLKRKRYLRPDLVLKETDEVSENRKNAKRKSIKLPDLGKYIDLNSSKQKSSLIEIIDYKYMRVCDYESYSPSENKNGENKIKNDIKKQLVYEWAVQQNWKVKTESEFWIPYFFNDGFFKKTHPINNPYFNKSQIKLVKINFQTIQGFYIKQGLV